MPDTTTAAAANVHPFSLDSSPAERRALKFKVFTFYGKWEPQKSVTDVNDLCEWALSNGVQVFNTKLQLKYGEDLQSVSVNSYLDLPIETQLKLFYSEFDTKKTAHEIENVALFARQHGYNGLTEINLKMNHKYGENLNSLAFGGRVHMRAILHAYFSKVDPLRCTSENINVTIDYVVINGALALLRELMERYKTPLQLSVNEIQGKQHEIDIDPSAAVAGLKAARPAVMSLMRGQQPVDGLAQLSLNTNTGAAVHSVRPLSMALSNKSSGSGGHAHGQQHGGGALTVSEDAEIKGLMEVFYAKNNPEKLASGGVDALIKFCRVYGLESVNQKLREKYDEDLDTLKAQYVLLMQQLTEYYQEVDPTKKNIEDIAAWAIVHGQQPLSERLKKRYGKPLFDDAPAALATRGAEPAAAAAAFETAAVPGSPAMSAPRVSSMNVDPEQLRAKLVIFYKTFDSKPKSNEDLHTIVNWVLAGSSVAQLNKKLNDKYGKTLDDVDLAPAPAPVAVVASAEEAVVADADDAVPVPEEIHHSVPVAPVASASPAISLTTFPQAHKSSAPSSRRNSPESQLSGGSRSRSESLSSDAGSADGMEEQMNNMRRITSGQYDQLGKQVRAFYRRYDPSKVENREALDLVMKWTFKHGPDALNRQFEKNYGRALFSVVVDEGDEEADEADDIMDAPPDW